MMTMPRSSTFSASVLLVCLCAAVPVRLWAVPEGRPVLVNGDFTQMQDGQPANWILYFESQNSCTFRLVEGEEGAKGKILAVDVHKTSVRPWAVQLRQELIRPIKKGETIYLSFEYKMTQGYAFQAYLQREQDPWPKYISLTLTEPFDRWETCSMALPAPADLPSNSASLSLHLAAKAGTVMFRNMSVFAYDATVTPDELNTTRLPVFGGDAADGEWRKTALARLQKERVAPLRIKVVREGEAVEDAVVKVKQVRNAVDLGVATPASVLAPDVLDSEWQVIKHEFNVTKEEASKFRDLVLESKLFSQIRFPELFTWRVAELIDQKSYDGILKMVRDQEMTIYGHALFPPSFRFAPPQSRQMTAPELSQALTKFVGDQAKRFRGQVARWNVVHAPLTYQEIFDMAGENSMLRAFQAARRGDSVARLVVSDDRGLTAPTLDQLEMFLSVVWWLRESGAQVDALAFQVSTGRPYLAPSAMEQRLDYITSVFELPIIISGLEIEGPTGEIQGERVRDLLTLFYSYPEVEAIVLSDIWGKVSSNPNVALFHNDLTPKPAGQIVRDLWLGTWRTEEEVKTDPRGMATVRGYTGTYDVTAEKGFRTVTERVSLTRIGQSVTIDLAKKKAD